MRDGSMPRCANHCAEECALLVMLEGAVLEEQARGRDLAQQRAPRVERGRRELRHAVEGPEDRRAAAAGEGRRRCRRGVRGRLPAVPAVRQAHESLRERLAVARRRLDRVRHQEAHLLHARRVEVVEPGAGDRGRAVREHRQPVAGRVAREVDGDVDAVLAHPRGQFAIAEGSRIRPFRGRRAKAGRQLVLDVLLRIAMHLEGLPVDDAPGRESTGRRRRTRGSAAIRSPA